MGAAYGTAKSGVGIAAMAIMKPERIMKSVIPIIMAGIVAIYGVVVAVLISQKTKGATSIMEVRLKKTINIFLTFIPRTLLIWVQVLPSVCLVYQLVWLLVLSVMPVFVELLNSQNFTLEWFLFWFLLKSSVYMV